MYIILRSKLKFVTKEIAKVLSIVLIGIILIIAMILIKYKPLYEITIAEKNIGYLKEKINIEEILKKELNIEENKNIDNIALKNDLKYNLKLVSRKKSSNLDEIINIVKNENMIITYKYYEVALNNEKQATVKTFEEAESIINNIKSEYEGNDLELDLQVNEIYEENNEIINLDSIELATNNMENQIEKLIENENVIAVVNGINLATLPVNGTITSRYGEISSRRVSTHTGLDIACKTGTPIKATATGTVTFAGRSGSYGNLVKVDHGNGVETWYGHCNTIITKVGKEVKSGDVIATVGSTGNSTGPHLHFEIRIDNKTVNPQNYLY